MNKKCIIHGCENYDDQGAFMKDMCLPCYEYLAFNKGNHSQAQRNEEQIYKLRRYLRPGQYKGDEKEDVNHSVYMIGEEDGVEVRMWYGPSPSLDSMLVIEGMSESSTIFESKNFSSPIPIYKWIKSIGRDGKWVKI